MLGSLHLTAQVEQAATEGAVSVSQTCLKPGSGSG